MTVDEIMEAYGELYPDRMTDEALEMYAPSALAYVGILTARRCETAEGWKRERVIQAVCACINEMAAQDAARSENGARLASVSNDGYTENYAADQGGGASAIRRAAALWLSGTGLVSAL